MHRNWPAYPLLLVFAVHLQVRHRAAKTYRWKARFVVAAAEFGKLRDARRSMVS
jgi:hypothetical protein